WVATLPSPASTAKARCSRCACRGAPIAKEDQNCRRSCCTAYVALWSISEVTDGAPDFRLGGQSGLNANVAETAAFDVVDGARSRHRSAIGWFVGDESHEGSRPMQITTIGLDIAKNVFQVHGIDTAEKVVVRKRLRRSQMLAFFKALPPCLVGM